MNADDIEQRCTNGNIETCPILTLCDTLCALKDLEAIFQAKGFDFRPDIVDFENRGLDLRLANETAGFLAALDQAGLHKLAHDLVDGHAGAIVVGGEINLERQPVTRRPFARYDPALDITEDSLVQGLPGRCFRHVRNAFQRLDVVPIERISAIDKFGHDLVEAIRYFAAMDVPARLHQFLPRTQTVSTWTLLANIHWSRIWDAGRWGMAEQSSATKSALFPASI